MDLESELDDEEENGESSEYFEELKPSPPFSRESKDPIIEISSDSEAEEEVIEALPTSTLPTSTLPTSTLPTSTLPTSTLPTSTLPTSTLPTSTVPTLRTPTWLNGMNERQQRALLELGMFSDEDSSNVRLPPVGPSRMGSNGPAGPPRIKKSQKRNQNALSEPGVPLQKDSLSLVIERDMAKRPRRALPNPTHLPKKTPCPSTSTSTTTSTSTSRSLGWNVEIKCPVCQMLVPGKPSKPSNPPSKPTLSNAKALLDHLRTVHGRLIGVTKKIWMVLFGSVDSFVKCPECPDTIVRISNLTRHFNKVHPETGVYDGLCGRCNKSVRKEDLQAHLDCSPPLGFVPPCTRAPPPLPPPPLPASAPQPTPALEPSYAVWSPSASAPQPEPYNYAVWSVLPGPCSFLQCPECTRKLPLDTVHQHLVSFKCIKHCLLMFLCF